MSHTLQEGSGFVAVRTGTLVIFGSYSSSMYPSVCVEAVEKLGMTMPPDYPVDVIHTMSCISGDYFRDKGK